MKNLLSIAIIILLTVNAYCLEPIRRILAPEYEDINIKCPLEGTEFTFNKMIPGALFATMLDGQQYGLLVSPDAVPKCPEDNFLIYKNDFSKKELKILKKFIASKEYKKLSENETDYWIIAQMQKKISASEKEILDSMQRATWEAYNNLDRDKYFRYTEATIKFIDKMKTPSNEDIYLKGELLRRTGNFDKASKVFNDLKKEKNIDNAFIKRLDQQIGLVEKKISGIGRIES
ncbi:MAG: hypothetical protein FWF00_03810 [Endomicrobia bacterium]|nr:hypothetical protein [Endomicrobiia bacterium]MCL2506797.1 hypothetical protein [Endomicrobiia bacterium]